MTDIERGRELLGILRNVNATVTHTIATESPGLLDRAAIVARLNLPLRLFIENPAYESLAKLGGARRLAQRTWSMAQQLWFEPGKNDGLTDNKLAVELQTEYDRLILVNRDALAAENKWARLPENLVDQAVSVFFKGVLDTLERWGKFLAAPFGIPWDLIILAGLAVLGLVLYKKAT